jgi:hypothetical protein
VRFSEISDERLFDFKKSKITVTPCIIIVHYEEVPYVMTLDLSVELL